MKAIEIPINEIMLNPDQPRKSIKNLDLLAESIEELGQMTPITVEKLEKPVRNKNYMLTRGERRFRACKEILKRQTIWAFVEEPSERRTEKMLAENLCRDQLNIIERIEGMAKFLEIKFGKEWRGILAHYNSGRRGEEETKIEKTCKSIGVMPNTLYSQLAVLKLSKDAKQHILDNAEYYADGVIQKLARIPEDIQLNVSKQISEQRMTTGQAINKISKEFMREVTKHKSNKKWLEIKEQWHKVAGTTLRCLEKAAELEEIPMEQYRDTHYNTRTVFLKMVEDINQASAEVLQKFRKEVELIPDENIP